MDVIYMRNALEQLSKIDEQTPECKKIYDSIIDYLRKNCLHSIIMDDIDVEYGERSIRIVYCEKCLLDANQLH